MEVIGDRIAVRVVIEQVLGVFDAVLLEVENDVEGEEVGVVGVLLECAGEMLFGEGEVVFEEGGADGGEGFVEFFGGDVGV